MREKKSSKKPGKARGTAASQESGPARRGDELAKKYVSAKISLRGLRDQFKRADLIFDCIDHAGVSFEARVFINNERADAHTPKSADSGYAGSFHIFGHGGCFGDVGHCDVRGTPRRYDPRPAHPLTPARKVLIATEAIRGALAQAKEMTVTVVPIVRAGTDRCDYQNVLKFDRIMIQTYN